MVIIVQVRLLPALSVSHVEQPVWVPAVILPMQPPAKAWGKQWMLAFKGCACAHTLNFVFKHCTNPVKQSAMISYTLSNRIKAKTQLTSSYLPFLDAPTSCSSSSIFHKESKTFWGAYFYFYDLGCLFTESLIIRKSLQNKSLQNNAFFFSFIQIHCRK